MIVHTEVGAAVPPDEISLKDLARYGSRVCHALVVSPAQACDGLHLTWPQVLRASTVASTHRNLGRQLVDGHWVLSFPDAEAAHTARDLVDQHQVCALPVFHDFSFAGAHE